MSVNELLAGRLVTPEQMEAQRQEVMRQLNKQGMNRLIEDIKGMLDDKYGTVKIVTTSESRDRQAWFQDRTALLAYLTPEDPRYSAIVDSIMDEMGITLEDVQLAVEKNVAPAIAPARQPEIGQTETVPAAQQV